MNNNKATKPKAKTWKLGSGEIVFDRENSHVATHPTVLPLLDEALSCVLSERRKVIEETLWFNRVVGETICVETSEQDEVLYAQRPNRDGLTRFVKNRQPNSCSCVTVSLFQAAEGDKYILHTAYIGQKAPAEPWDEQRASDEAIAFWRSHALVWGREDVIPGTETSQCPW